MVFSGVLRVAIQVEGRVEAQKGQIRWIHSPHPNPKTMSRPARPVKIQIAIRFINAVED